mgnify:CR=1 FL=1
MGKKWRNNLSFSISVILFMDIFWFWFSRRNNIHTSVAQQTIENNRSIDRTFFFLFFVSNIMSCCGNFDEKQKNYISRIYIYIKWHHQTTETSTHRSNIDMLSIYSQVHTYIVSRYYIIIIIIDVAKNKTRGKISLFITKYQHTHTKKIHYHPISNYLIIIIQFITCVCQIVARKKTIRFPHSLFHHFLI